MRNTLTSPALILIAALAAATAANAQDAPAYSNSLALVYGAHQRVLTLKDACASALPKRKPDIDKAYDAWKARNQKVLGELDDHVAAMIRRQSKDAKEYAINVGKYEGGRLQEREEGKQAFLSLPRSEVEQLCTEFPKTLSGGDTDLERAYADELRTIRKR
jgi:hypothetical protein